MIPEELVCEITEQTNNYYKCVQQCSNYNNSSRLKIWKDTSFYEMYGFLCISMLMPRSKKLSLKEYWSTDELLKSGIFRNIMSMDRYMMLLQMLHFNDNTTATNDPLVKLRPVIDSIKTSFSKSFVPNENLYIDFCSTKVGVILNSLYRPKEVGLALNRLSFVIAKPIIY